MTDMLINELTALVDRQRLNVIGGMAQNARVDALVRLVRSMYEQSSLCYVGSVMSWYDGRSYQPVTAKELYTLTSNILCDAGVSPSDIRRMGYMPQDAVFKVRREADGTMISFTNCIYDIERGKALPFSKDIVAGWSLPYAYNRKAACRQWDVFLAEVMPDNDERSCLQEFFGMCLVDRSRMSIEKMALMIGSGANGKSVCFDVIRHAIGMDMVSYLSPDQIADVKQRSAMIGKRLNFSPDLDRRSSLGSFIKAMASGQTTTAWKLYDGTKDFDAPPMAFAMNEVPKIYDCTEGFFRRLLVFSFDVTIPKERQDAALAGRIIDTELAGVFNWLCEGRRRLVSGGGKFTQSARIDEAVKNLRHTASGRSAFDEQLESIGWAVTGDRAERVSADLIADAMHLTKNSLTRELTKLGVRVDRGYYWLYRI